MDNQKRNTSEDQNSDRYLTGMFQDRESAEKVYTGLQERGYTKDDINLVMSDETRKKYFDDKDDVTDLGSKALEGAGAGSAIGGTVGAIAGIIAAVGTSILIPGLGLVIAGPIAGGLAGAGAGGLTGGIIGALIGAGIPEDRAKVYEAGLKDGRILIGLKPKNQEDANYFEEDWRKNKGEDVYVY